MAVCCRPAAPSRAPPPRRRGGDGLRPCGTAAGGHRRPESNRSTATHARVAPALVCAGQSGPARGGPGPGQQGGEVFIQRLPEPEQGLAILLEMPLRSRSGRAACG
jgi:hypothetical protein